jgi:hypothetical protein
MGKEIMDDDIIFPANIVTCPECSVVFQHNKINGIALIQAIKNIDARKRMYCKLSLDDLERIQIKQGSIEFSEAKKIILDNFNDFVRDIQTILGLGAEAE